MKMNTLRKEETQNGVRPNGNTAPPLSERVLFGSLFSTFLSSSLAASVGMTAGFKELFWMLVAVHYVSLGACNASAFWRLLTFFRNPRAQAAVGCALVVGALFLGRLGSFPVTATDALVHHLAVPKWWLASGHIHNVAWHEWSYYPMSVNIGYVFPLHFNASRFSALYHLAYWLPVGALTGVLAAATTQKMRHASFAAFLALSLPLFLRLASIPLVDLGLTAACGTALVLVTRSFQQHPAPVVALLGVSLGAVLSSKLNGILFMASFAVGLMIATVTTRSMIARSVRQLVPALVLAIICFAPWGLKNYWDTGNPIYPLYRGMLGGPSLNLLEAPGGLHPLVHRQEIYGETILDLLLIPLRMIFFGADNDPREFDGVLTPLFLFAFFPFFQRRKSRELTFNLLVVVVYVAGALLASGARARYLCPILPAVCMLAALPITAWVRDPWTKGFLAIAATLQGIWAGGYAFELWNSRGVWPRIGDRTAEERYLSRRLSDYPLIRYTNAHLTPDDRVYLLGTPNRFFFFDRSVLSRGYYSMNEIISWIRTGSQPDQLARRFGDLQVTHLFVGTDRLKELLATLLTPSQGEIWNAFSSQHLELVHVESGYSLWKIRQ
jgi:hypothetical protein